MFVVEVQHDVTLRTGLLLRQWLQNCEYVVVVLQCCCSLI